MLFKNLDNKAHKCDTPKQEILTLKRKFSMKKNLLCSPIMLLLGTIVILFAQTPYENIRHEVPLTLTEKLFPDTTQEWPESPVPQSLWRGAKKKFPKGKL